MFSDYHLIYKFVDMCGTDIKKTSCGRLNKNGESLGSDSDEEKELTGSLADYVTSQADTVDCLINSIVNLTKNCQHEILRLSELQSDDYHLNRKLYMACREDRDVLCSKVHSGEGRVYACLMKHKFSDSMSKRCQEQLTKKYPLMFDSLVVDIFVPDSRLNQSTPKRTTSCSLIARVTLTSTSAQVLRIGKM